MNYIESIILNDIQDTIPKGYIIRNDGIFGEWNLWLDDTLGTIIGEGYRSKQDAIQAAWQHKSNQSKGNVMNNQDGDLFLICDGLLTEQQASEFFGN